MNFHEDFLKILQNINQILDSGVGQKPGDKTHNCISRNDSLSDSDQQEDWTYTNYYLIKDITTLQDLCDRLNNEKRFLTRTWL